MQPTLIGVGVGPGDPELITLKAARHIKTAEVISFITNAEGHSQAKSIAQSLLDQTAPKQEIPIRVLMCKDRSVANAAYDKAINQIETTMKQGQSVVFLCEGDPLFFGSFTYLLQRLPNTLPAMVVPGITSVNAASAVLQQPLTLLNESFSVMSGRHSHEQLCHALLNNNSVAIMKAGQSRPKILAALRQTNRIEEAQYLEYIGRQQESITLNAAELDDDPGPYFSLFIVTQSRQHRLTETRDRR